MTVKAAMKIPDPNGFTLRHRKRWQGSYHLDPLLWVMMSWFIDHAQWEDKTIKIPGKKPIKLKRGQCIFSERSLSKFFKIGRQQTRTRLTFMKTAGFLTHELTQRTSIATIVNYDTYQLDPDGCNPKSNRKPTQTPTHVPFNEVNKYNKRAGDKSPSEKEKKQIADAALRRVDSTTKYLSEKTAIAPVLNINADDIKSKLQAAAKRQETNFK